MISKPLQETATPALGRTTGTVLGRLVLFLATVVMQNSMIQIFSFLACVSSVLNLVAASNVIDLTPANFDEIVGAGRPALVHSVVEYPIANL